MRSRLAEEDALRLVPSRPTLTLFYVGGILRIFFFLLSLALIPIFSNRPPSLSRTPCPSPAAAWAGARALPGDPSPEPSLGACDAEGGGGNDSPPSDYSPRPNRAGPAGGASDPAPAQALPAAAAMTSSPHVGGGRPAAWEAVCVALGLGGAGGVDVWELFLEGPFRKRAAAILKQSLDGIAPMLGGSPSVGGRGFVVLLWVLAFLFLCVLCAYE